MSRGFSCCYGWRWLIFTFSVLNIIILICVSTSGGKGLFLYNHVDHVLQFVTMNSKNLIYLSMYNFLPNRAFPSLEPSHNLTVPISDPSVCQLPPRHVRPDGFPSHCFMNGSSPLNLFRLNAREHLRSKKFSPPTAGNTYSLGEFRNAGFVPSHDQRRPSDNISKVRVVSLIPLDTGA